LTHGESTPQIRSGEMRRIEQGDCNGLRSLSSGAFREAGAFGGTRSGLGKRGRHCSVAARYSRGANHLLRQAALYLKLQRLEHRLKPPTSERPLEKRRNGGGLDIHPLVPHLELLLHASAVRDDVEFPFLEVGDLVMISL